MWSKIKSRSILKDTRYVSTQKMCMYPQLTRFRPYPDLGDTLPPLMPSCN